MMSSPFFSKSIDNEQPASTNQKPYKAFQKGAYFAATQMASIMLTADASPLPAMSKAVPWSTDVRKIGIPQVMEMVRSKS